MYLISEENLKLLGQIFSILEQIEIKGYQNMGFLFQSLTLLKKIVSETENNPLIPKPKKDGENAHNDNL